MSEIKDQYFAAQRALLTLENEKKQLRLRETIEKNKIKGLELSVDEEEFAEVEKAWTEELAKRAAKKTKPAKSEESEDSEEG